MEQDKIEAAWGAGLKCERCAIRELVLFADLDKSDFELIHHPINEFELDVGETLYRQGDCSEAIYTLRSGLLKLVSYLADGSFRIIRIIKSGDVVGLEALDNECYSHRAIVLEKASFCRIPVAQIEKINMHSHHLSKQLTARWRHVIADADVWLSRFSSGFAKQRVAYLLLYLSDGNAAAECYLPTREDIGAILGVTTETSSRVIADFKRKGVITLLSPYTVSVDKERLVELSGNY